MMNTQTASTVDLTDFRAAMGSFPTGVTVVTVACEDGDLHGVTVNSFSSVSLNPTLVLVCLDAASRTVRRIEHAGVFGISVLSTEQRDIARWFANPERPAGPAMFDGVLLESGVTGCPVLVGAAASLECWRRQSYRAGDHLHPGAGPGPHPNIGDMRYESSVTSLSWIPSEAITGASRVLFDAGFTHYDDPPPAELEDVEELRAADRFRFANVLRAWIEVDGAGQITAGGYGGGGVIGASTVRFGGLRYAFQAAALPDVQREPERAGSSMRFVQSSGGRTALPAPRPVQGRPFAQWRAPLAWTTLSLTLHADGRAEYALEGASRFPRHWIYGADGRLTHKSGLTDYANWMRASFGHRTPWGSEDSPALVTAVETALEQTLSVQLMRGGAKPRIVTIPAGADLVRQGEAGDEIYLLLDGVIAVERDGSRLAEVGPGALLGERAGLEGGVRTATLVAVTPCRVASAPAAQFDPAALAELATGHRREDLAQEEVVQD